ncbi:gfo/Idh/MocA family oxidoreductase [Coraliomargarita sinensis]|uniref:Gfo/Idh/MocA family oxidoreductase n=1 Tax=Coraliomargarita sinensis TaxID=2174842 RepID=A0A317ZIR2_9BACT|nr:Gfo/Idh/MocA family oxidoreductase [Coraliomargarita sinensis]PXA05466.1 gfo/Idh/MocA family oxidoreductase [Coraliomargarita sinensis]
MNDPIHINRRSFLKSSATAGLTLGMPTILKSNPLKTASDEIRIGLIGCGAQQEVLYDTMKNIPGIRFVAACDIMMEGRLKKMVGRIRSAFGYRINHYSDAETMLEKEGKHMDAVFVATPDFWHAPHTVMALEAGCHVYCEKMMSDTLEGARSMVAAMDRTGQLCQIGHQRRSNPRYLYVLNELIRKQQICGQIVNVNGQWNRSLGSSSEKTYPEKNIHHLPDAATLRQYGFNRNISRLLDETELRKRFLNWRFYKALSGGPISDLGAHQIDIFNWFLDARPKSVQASGGRSYFDDREHFDNVMCLFDYDTPQGNARAFYQVLTTTSAGGGYYESFMGTQGTINISEREAYTKIYKESWVPSAEWRRLVDKGFLKKVSAGRPSGSPDAIASYESAPPDEYAIPGGIGLNSPYHHHIQNFFQAIRGQAKLNCDACHALESEAPIYWVNQAAETNETITFTDEHLRT